MMPAPSWRPRIEAWAAAISVARSDTVRQAQQCRDAREFVMLLTEIINFRLRTREQAYGRRRGHSKRFASGAPARATLGKVATPCRAQWSWNSVAWSKP